MADRPDFSDLTNAAWGIVTGLRNAGIYDRMEEGQKYRLEATITRKGDAATIDELQMLPVGPDARVTA